MKKIFLTIFSLLLIFAFIQCSSKDNNSSNPVGSGFGLGGGGLGGGTTSVTFQISTQQGQNGGTIFFATPSLDVKITKVTLSVPAQQFEEPVEGDGTTVFKANETVSIEEITGVASGQQWEIKFEGTLANNNQAFNVTSNYTVP